LVAGVLCDARPGVRTILVLDDAEVEAVRSRWQAVFERLPVLDNATEIARSLFVVNIDTSRPVPIGGLNFFCDAVPSRVHDQYADALVTAGFVRVDASGFGDPTDWHGFRFVGFGLPWVFSIRPWAAGTRVKVHTDAVDAPGAAPIGLPPEL
jgi:hypothetical protein